MIEHQEIKQRVGYLLARICHAHRNTVNEALTSVDLHVGQEMFLLCLWSEDGVTQTELADCLGVQQATVTRMLDRMARAGLVERRKDPADQRVCRVHLTDEGWRLRQPVAKIWQEVEDQLLQNFTLDEKVLLRRLLLQLYENLTA